MAEKVLFNIAGGILSGLSRPLVAEEIRLLLGAERELEELTDTISTIRDVLLDAEERECQSHTTSLWLERLSDVLYEADDLLDAISTEVRRREIMTKDKKVKKVRIFFSESNQLAFRLKMCHKIKAIKRRLDAIKVDRDFHLDICVEEIPVKITGRGETYSFASGQHVIGRENDRNEVIRRLLDTNTEESLSILPIVGIGGLGKTTLTQLVFNDERVERNFDIKMWVCVSHNFNMKIVVERILGIISNEKSEKVEMDLEDRLRKEIVTKKFFLVLDDLWNIDGEKWLELKKLLTNDVVGSRILITTRSSEVASIICTVEPFMLGALKEEESWSLFKEMAFNGEEPENLSIKQIGKDVMRKCEGVPLALQVIGRMLFGFGKDSVEKWVAFKDNQLSKISKTTILATLKLSYDTLPSYLKYCFVYCSLFPKGYVFDVSTHINLWIAQGFINSQENQCLEDIGHEYFMTLLFRSFFHELKLDNSVKYKMQNHVHDLAISMAGALIFDSRRSSNENARHLAIYSSNIPTSSYKASKVRTFLSPGVSKYFTSKINCEAIFSSFKLLRVLDLRNRKLKQLSSSIEKLKHLRYLDLSHNNEIWKLPNSISRIPNLETLKLSNCWLLEELPRDIDKLVDLRHLEIDGCWGLKYMPRGLRELTNLQTLPLFVINSCSYSKHIGGLEELNRLNNLRGHLRIQYLSHVEGAAERCRAANLNEKSQLCGLDLNWNYEGNVSDSDMNADNMSLEFFNPNSNLKQLYLKDYRGSKVPSWLLSLTNLVELKLLWCRKCESLSPVRELPSLKCLWLWNMQAMEYMSDLGDSNQLSSSSLDLGDSNQLSSSSLDLGDSNQFSSSSTPAVIFPSLKELWLSDCPRLRGWWKRDSYLEVVSNSHSDEAVAITATVPMTSHHLLPSFGSLSKLKIEECPLLTLMPTFPRLEEELYLYKANWTPLKRTMMMNPSEAPLSNLKHLKLRSVMQLETLPKEWMQSLTSLKTLTIESCKELKSLSSGMEHLGALEHLNLSFCPELMITKDEDGTHWLGLQSLLSVSFKDLPKLMSLPSSLQHVTTLQNLEISHCGSLTVLPEWIQESKSIEVLKVVQCSKLTSLPQGMRRLTIIEDANDEKRPISPR